MRLHPGLTVLRGSWSVVSRLGGSLALLLWGSLCWAQELDAGMVLQRAFKTYEAAKSYHGIWSYRLSRGAATREMRMEVRYREGSYLDHRISNLPDQKAAPGIDPIPEMRVLLDGKEGWFENRSDNTYFKVKLPAGARVSPLLFFPQMLAPGGVKLGKPTIVDGRACYAVEALRSDGSLVRMEIDRETSRIRRISSELTVAGLKIVSVLAAAKETFDADAVEKEFRFKPEKGSKEIASPPGIEGLFGKQGGEPPKPAE